MSKQQKGSSYSSKYETEVEKLRNENNWNRLREYAMSIPHKDAKTEQLAKFCIAEAELENYLYKNPLQFPSSLNSTPDMAACQPQVISTSKSISRFVSHDSLENAEKTFKAIVDKSDEVNTICIESSLLLAKLFFAQTRYDDALKQLNSRLSQTVLTSHLNKFRQNQQAGSTLMEQLTPKADTIRQYQIFSEAHSIRALCIERNQTKKSTYQSKLTDEQELIDSFEVASLLAIQHSILIHTLVFPQSNNNSTNISNTNSTNTIDHLDSAIASNVMPTSLNLNVLNNSEENLDLINPLYEIALQKAPLLYIKKGDLKMGMRKFRDLLFKKNIQSITSIRQVLLKEYAECLMFSIPSSHYDPLPFSSQTNDKNKPFKPNNQDEEILLCLVLSQYLASKEVMLLRQPQFKQIREQTLANAISSLDLILFYLGYHRSYNVLSDKFELVMKFSFEQFYVWHQYALTLLCDKKYYRAYLTFKECVRMKPDHIGCHLMLARTALENLYLIDESIDWSMKVLEMSANKNLKAHVLLGCGMCYKACLQKQHSQQISFYEKALDAFKKANAIDPSDYIPIYHIARCYSILRQINESIDYVQKALKYKPDDKDSLHLLTLLLTSLKNYEEAHIVISKACALYDDIELMYTKIRIEEILFGFSYSVNSIVSLILLYKQNQKVPKERQGSTNSSTVSTLHQSGFQSINKSPPQFNMPQSLENWPNFESAFMQEIYKLNESVGKTVTILVESDQLALKYGNSISQSKNLQQLLILVRILTQVGEFYLRHDKLNDAESCCQEIALKHPMSYLHIYLKGRIHEYKQDYASAKLCYQNALSINPNHIQSLQHMSLVLCQMQNFHLAEKMIRDAISLNSSLPDSWHILARVLDYQDDNQSAMKCYQTCLQLELTNPIIPFTSLTRVL